LDSFVNQSENSFQKLGR